MGVYADSSPDAFDDPKVETIVEILTRIWGSAIGIVSTACKLRQLLLLFDNIIHRRRKMMEGEVASRTQGPSGDLAALNLNSPHPIRQPNYLYTSHFIRKILNFFIIIASC
jgi:hypothetical protein